MANTLFGSRHAKVGTRDSEGENSGDGNPVEPTESGGKDGGSGGNDTIRQFDPRRAGNEGTGSGSAGDNAGSEKRKPGRPRGPHYRPRPEKTARDVHLDSSFLAQILQGIHYAVDQAAKAEGILRLTDEEAKLMGDQLARMDTHFGALAKISPVWKDGLALATCCGAIWTPKLVALRELRAQRARPKPVVVPMHPAGNPPPASTAAGEKPRPAFIPGVGFAMDVPNA